MTIRLSKYELSKYVNKTIKLMRVIPYQLNSTQLWLLKDYI